MELIKTAYERRSDRFGEQKVNEFGKKGIFFFFAGYKDKLIS